MNLLCGPQGTKLEKQERGGKGHPLIARIVFCYLGKGEENKSLRVVRVIRGDRRAQAEVKEAVDGEHNPKILLRIVTMNSLLVGMSAAAVG